jgi:ABC-type antimicrobial peptide transport system permease subunit
MSAGYGAPGEFGGGGQDVLVPKVTLEPGTGRAVFDYSRGQTYSFQTVGGYRFGDYSTPQIVVPLDIFRRIWAHATGGAPLLVPQVSVSVGSLFAVESVVSQLRELLPDCTVVSVPAAAAEGSARGLPEAWSQWRQRPGEASVVAGQIILPSGIKTVMMALTCMLGAVVVAANSLVMLTQRRREIGILRAVGAKRRDIMVMILTEVGLVAAIGSAVGYAAIRVAVIWNQVSNKTGLAAVGLSAVLDGAKVMAATLLCAVVLGLAPALRSTSISTMDVLRQE